MEELSEIIHRGRKHRLIIRIASQIKDWNAYEVTDDLGSTLMMCPSIVDCSTIPRSSSCATSRLA
jgi:hypothetical protein